MVPFIPGLPYDREPARFFAPELRERPFDEAVVRLDDERPFEERPFDEDDERVLFRAVVVLLRPPPVERLRPLVELLRALPELELLRALVELFRLLPEPELELELLLRPLVELFRPLPELELALLRPLLPLPPLLWPPLLWPPLLWLRWLLLLWLLLLLERLCPLGASGFSIKTYALKRARSARTARFTWRMPRAAFSIIDPGWTSRLTSTRVRRGPSSWNVTTPACVTPSVTFHLIRSPGSFSTISALNSFEIPQIFVLNEMCSSSSSDTLWSRCMNVGHSS